MKPSSTYSTSLSLSLHLSHRLVGKKEHYISPGSIFCLYLLHTDYFESVGTFPQPSRAKTSLCLVKEFVISGSVTMVIEFSAVYRLFQVKYKFPMLASGIFNVFFMFGPNELKAFLKQ